MGHAVGPMSLVTMARIPSGIAISLLVILAVSGPAHGQQSVSPSEDLAQVTHEATSGSVLQLGSGRFNGPIVVEGKTLTLKGQPDGSTVIATDRSNAAVLVTDGAQATLENIVVEAAQSGQMGLYVKSATLDMIGGRVTKSADHGIYVESAKLSLVGTAVEDSAGAGLIGQKGSDITIDRARFERIAGTAVHQQDGAKLTVKGSQLAGKAAIVVFGGAPEVLLEANRLTGQAVDQAVIALDQGGSAVVRGNTISGGDNNIVALPAPDAKIEIADNLMYGTKRGAITIQAREALTVAPTLSGNRILIDGADDTTFGIYLTGATTAQMSGNFIVTRKGYGLAVRDKAVAHLADNLILADAIALSVANTDATATQLAGTLLVPVDGVEGQPSVDARTQALAASLDSGRADSMRQARDKALEMAAAGAADPAVTVETYFTALEAQLSEIKAAAANFGSISLRVRDAIGKEDVTPFALLDESGNELSRHSAANPTASVAPGTYLIAPDFDPLQVQDVTVAAGENVTARLDQPEALWLTFAYHPKRGPTHALMKLRSQADRKELAASIRESGHYQLLAERRSAATKQDLELALDLARRWIYEESKTKRPSDNDSASWGRYHMTNDLAYRILGLAGDASDVEQLAKMAADNGYLGSKSTFGVAMSLIEARLGKLQTGKLAELAASEDEAMAIGAAIILHEHGVRSFDAKLLQSMASPKDVKHRDWNIYYFAFAMLDDGRPEVLSIVRQLWDRFQARKVELAGMTEEQRKGQYNELGGILLPGAAYLLAHGGPEDWARVALDPVEFYSASMVAAFGADPAQAAGILADQRNIPSIFGIATHLAALKRDDTAAAFKSIGDQVYNAKFYAEVEAGNSYPDEPARQMLNNFHGISSSLWPNEDMAEYYYHGAEKLKVDPLPWAPFEWTYAEVADRIVKGDRNSGFFSQLDFMPHAQLEQLLAERNAAQVLPSVELLLAYHKVATRASWVGDPTDDGRMIGNVTDWQRPFLVKIPSGEKYGGAISGRLDFHPAFVNNELRLRFELPHFGFYHEYCSLAAMIGANNCDRSYWQHHAVVQDARGLVTGVRLIRGEETIALQERPHDKPDQLIYAGELGGRDLSDLRVEVDLALGEERRSFSFALYSSDFAKWQRIADSQLAAARAAAGSAPNDVAALMTLAESTRLVGDLDGAWQAYARVLAVDPGITNLWFDGAAMFEEAGLAERAVAVFEEAAAARPDDLDIRFSLGVTAYNASDFPRAARAFGRVVEAAPDDHEARLWHGHALFLSHEWAGAAAAYAALPEDRRTPQVALLQMIAGAEAAGGATSDLAAYEAGIERMRPPAEGGEQPKALEPCQVDFYGGYRHRFSGQADEAKAAFERAHSSCALGTIEHRAVSMILQ
jgi:hypothetical protein